MTALDLDPMFVKALKLLHSRNKDSAAQLKSMLDDVIAQKRGQKPASSEFETPSEPKPEKEANRKRDTEKRNFEKFSQSLDTASVLEAKKPRRDSPVPTEKDSSKSSSEREKDRHRKEKELKERERKDKERKEREREKEREKEKERQEKEKESKDAANEKESSGEDKSMDADDFAFDLGISCVVCRQFDVSSKNQLVECQECHSLYHQECHRPPFTEQDVNDPRFVWYCSRCSKTLKKQVAKPTKSKTTSGQPATKEQTPSFSKPPKNETSPSNVLPFRRADTKSSSSKEPSSSKSVSSKDTGSSKPLSGLTSLAANLSGKTETSKPKSSDSSKKMEKFASMKFDSLKQTAKSEEKEKEKEKSTSSSSKSSSSKSSSSSGGGSSSSSSSHGSVSRQLSNPGLTAAASADKRLQMMKKKASAKFHDKKVHVK